MSKYWNRKLSGIPSFFFLILILSFRKIFSKIEEYLFIMNINECGKNCIIMSGVQYRYPKKIEFGNNICIGEKTALLSEISSSPGLFLEDGVSIGGNCNIDFSGGLTIRQGAHIAHNVLISTHDHGYDYRSDPIGKPLVIAQDAFIGSNCVILHNVNRIGNSAVIGTGTVVTKDVPDFAIVVGNPGRVIKYVNNNSLNSKNG